MTYQNHREGLAKFDDAIFGHFGYVFSNAVRTLVMAFTNAGFVRAPDKRTKAYYQYMSRFSSALAFASDIAIFVLGGTLKRKEKLSGRLGDVLSMLYLGSAVLKQFEDHGEPEEELPVVQWACQYILYQAQRSLYGALVNFPNRHWGAFLRAWVFPLGRTHTQPSDKLGQQIARLLLLPDSLRSNMAKGAYLNPDPKNPTGYIEVVLRKVIDAEPLEQRLHQAVRDKEVHGYTYQQKVEDARVKNVLTQAEADQLMDTYRCRREVLAVDDFAPDDLEDRFH